MELANEQLLQECVVRGLLTNKQVDRILHKENIELQFQQEADLWIAFNSDMFSFMEQAALELHQKGKKFSSRLLSENARWLYEGKTQKIGNFKIKDSLARYVAKRIVERHPELVEYIKFRRTFKEPTNA